jgi:hypothetical protein
MACMTAATWLVVLTIAGALLAGCASPAATESPQVRCLDTPRRNDPRLEATRPMFFLFCIQS